LNYIHIYQAQSEIQQFLNLLKTLNFIQNIYKSSIQNQGFFFPKSKRTTSECFYIFNLIHHLTNNLNIIKRITREVIEDYSKENTKYLEIRTTPRKLEENNSLKYNKREYIEAILEEINTYKTNFPENFYDINLILSIDRSNSNLNALETVILILNKGSFGKRV
jgi:adenosine deaminase